MGAANLTVAVSTDKQIYRQGEVVQIPLTIQNQSASPQIFSVGGDTAPVLSIRQGDQTVFKDSIFCATEACSDRRTLAPGESFFSSLFRWNQADLRFGFCSNGEPCRTVSPGTYQIQVIATEIDGDTQRRVASNLITIQITP